MNAFPSPRDPKTGSDDKGMSLRDYFAAKAMQAFLSSWIIRNDYPETDSIVAEHAYEVADAMLKARDL
jgi:hypothetical protein